MKGPPQVNLRQLSQVAADGGCERDAVHRMNEGYEAWGTLKSLLSNRGLEIRDQGQETSI